MHVGFDESDQMDFKESRSDGALKDLSSFANTRGGTVYVGVNNRGFAIGTDVSDAQQQRVANQVSGLLGLVPDVWVERFETIDVLAVRITRSSQPVLLRGT